ncbi:MAG: ATPase [Flavobacteriales bacterium]|nr:ATPase [Flavobacteriales bacterium]
MLKNLFHTLWRILKSDFKKTPFLWISLVAVLVVIIDIGFPLLDIITNFFYLFYLAVLWSAVVSIFYRYSKNFRGKNLGIWIFDFLTLLFFMFLLFSRMGWLNSLTEWASFLNGYFWIYLGIVLYFIREFSDKKIHLSKLQLNPAQLFIVIFSALIFVGCIFLLLPNATNEGISFIDALFTATSAVCVTGLVVVDTGTYFTQFGQTVILILMQLGGIGIMTFASYFSYFFKGGSSYENQLLLKDMTNSDKISEVFQTLKKIIFLTFFIEAIGAVIIFFSLDTSTIALFSDQVFFAFFHSVSAFCNAGFSTLSSGLYEPAFRFNYPLHLIISVLFILGSIGFPIIFNVFKYLKFYILKKLTPYRKKQKPINLLWIVNLNTRIILSTTLILIVGGTFLFFIIEYNNSLRDLNFIGKVVTSFFGSTARTSGFNTFDTGTLNFTTLMLLMVLMWIGGSPASAAGGIKTSTFAIASLNIFNLAKGRDRIEVFGREIAEISIRRSFAIIMLSFMAIGIAVVCVSAMETDFSLLSIIFECVSAYSTTGYSMGITGELSTGSKLVITLTMFLGRITMLTVLIAFLRKARFANYRYPTEEILIN